MHGELEIQWKGRKVIGRDFLERNCVEVSGSRKDLKGECREVLSTMGGKCRACWGLCVISREAALKEKTKNPHMRKISGKGTEKVQPFRSSIIIWMYQKRKSACAPPGKKRRENYQYRTARATSPP
jgi:hypothetical protein